MNVYEGCCAVAACSLRCPPVRSLGNMRVPLLLDRMEDRTNGTYYLMDVSHARNDSQIDVICRKNILSFSYVRKSGAESKKADSEGNFQIFRDPK